MKTTIEPKTPQQVGMSLIVCTGPRGTVRDSNWPCIEWTLQLQKEGKLIWTGEYRAGVGHVKVPKTYNVFALRLTPDEQSLLMTWQSKPHAQFVNKQLWADVAAKLAKSQRVIPSLEDVCSSLLMDGSAFFDGQRFEDWAGDFGYSADSIKAKETFELCDRIGRDLARAFTREELESLREWAGNQ